MSTSPRFTPVSSKVDFPQLEEQILAFWKENDSFRTSLELREGAELYTFYDGPPFATGLPHYGHILAGAIKDVVPRYHTMLGKYVPRRFGWDCHGVPVEHEMEKQLGFKNREDIERYGIKEFCEACRGIVLKHTAEWESTVERMGRWVDFQNDYKTMDPDYMESILWVFAQLWKKGMIYEGKKVVAYSPKLASTLSNFEANLNYKDIDDPAVTVRFELADEPGTYLLAWTTTPWTLVSNLGLVVSPTLEYVKVEFDGDQYILSKSIFERDDGKVFGFSSKEVEPEREVVETMSGSDLVGKRYTPLFPFFKDHPNAFQVFGDDFVSDSEGTGIVHMAPTGEDDARILQANDVELFYPFTDTCYFDESVPPLKGKYFRYDPVVEGSKENNANDWVLRQLKESGQLVKREQIRHSYPHCWRTDCALMYRGVHTFFVDVQGIKQGLLEKNAEINWVPEHLKYGRFGKMLENAPDWAISRSRYWGAPIPVWKCEACEHREVVGSIKEIAQKATKKSSFFVARHAEGEHNVQGIISSALDDNVALTAIGEEQAKALGEQLKDKNIELIICSPLLRTQQTAQIVKETAGIFSEIVIDERIKEIDAGTMDGEKMKDWEKIYSSPQSRYFENPHNGESSHMVGLRIVDFMHDIRDKYPDTNILIVTHGAVVRSCLHYFHNLPNDKVFKTPIPPASFHEFSFSARPENDNREIDLHRPYIDQITFDCPKCNGIMKRVPDVLDCWFESGSMPYAQNHFPFRTNPDTTDCPDGFPADFIAEGLDQTRGWFYTLHVLANALYENPSFKNVVVNGIVLAEDGHKMSKSKKNYPVPQIIFDKYGADAMRFYLLNSPVVRAEDFRFSEDGVAEVLRKVILPLWNSYSFFVTYANIDEWNPQGSDQQSKNGKQEESQNKLGRWILAELGHLVRDFRKEMDAYQLEAACREIPEFLDKLTNFYIRRSRRRFWKSEADADKQAAFETLYTVLKTIVGVIAPITPFVAEAIWKNLRSKDEPESIHHTDFPKAEDFADDAELRKEIDAVRTVISLALAVRSKQKIRVRQPLSVMKVALPSSISNDMVLANNEVIAEEVNVKALEICQDPDQLAESYAKPDARKLGLKFGKEVQDIIREAKAGNFLEKAGKVNVAGKWELEADEVEIGFAGKAGLDVESEKGIVVALDTEITEELKQEGIAREIIRHLQEMRKDADYDIADRITVAISGADTVLAEFKEMIASEVLAESVVESLSSADSEKPVEIEGTSITLAIKK